VESERAFQDKVIAVAIMYGWKVQHSRPAMLPGGGWATHIQGHVGFPDLVLVHRDRGVIYAELKAERGKVSPSQADWLETLTAAGAETYLWRPRDFQFIVKRLAGTHDR
jgi:hypothetical protein